MHYKLTEFELSCFTEKFVKGSPDECWNWTAYKMKSGHGQLRLRGKIVYAYRLAYFLENGPFDDNLCILHKCDNGACVNPAHLFIGTQSDNMDDKVAKKRHTVGTAVSGHLTEQNIEDIKRLYSTGNYTQRSLGFKFKVHQATIGRIVNGLRWRHTYNPVGTEPAIVTGEATVDKGMS